MTLVFLALAGGFGAVARYLVDRFLKARSNSPFPYGTLTVNVTGSAALGALTAAALAGLVPSGVLAWAGVGFFGGYTTFSTFTYDTLRLLESRAFTYAALNIALSGPLSFAAAAATFFAVS